MPEIEGTHLGSLPCTAFNRAFLVRKIDIEFYDLPIDTANV